jgi:hypothetical protein
MQKEKEESNSKEMGNNNKEEGGGTADIAVPIETPVEALMGLPMRLPMGLRWDCDTAVITAPMGLRYTDQSRRLAWLVVGRRVGRLELKCNCNPVALRRKPTANASEGGVMQLQVQMQLQLND